MRQTRAIKKWLSCLALVATCMVSSPVLAQADTERARQVYIDVNQQLSTYKKAAFKAKRPDVSYTSNVKVWRDILEIRKIEVTDLDDSGDVITEYYYTGGQMVFAYQAVKGFNDKNKQVTRHEERQYFEDGKMFKWLSGTDKSIVAANSSDFAAEAKTRLAASTFYLKTAVTAMSGKK